MNIEKLIEISNIIDSISNDMNLRVQEFMNITETSKNLERNECINIAAGLIKKEFMGDDVTNQIMHI